MSSYLIDANTLVYSRNADDETTYTQANGALIALRRRRQPLRLTPQVLIEFRRTCTRPGGEGGLGMTLAQAVRERERAERLFEVVPETPEIYAAWRRLTDAVDVRGKQVHDARLVAVCHAAGIECLLTFNVSDFTRFTALGPGLTVVHPRDVV